MIKIQIITPQFEREPGTNAPALPPRDWKVLLTANKNWLQEIGCRAWNDPLDDDAENLKFEGKCLMLFPGEWYASIPEGFEVVTISGARKKFERGKTDDDIRFGCLAYGVLV